MSKGLRLLAIVMPFVIVGLFFMPLLSMTRVFEDSTYTDLISLYSIAKDRSLNVLASVVIGLFIISLVISIVCSILAQKRIATIYGNILSLSGIWIIASVLLAFYTQHNYQYSSHAAFYISLILSVFFLAVFIAYAVKWLKARLASIPPPRAQTHQVRAHSGTGTAGRRTASKGKGRRIASFLAPYTIPKLIRVLKLLLSNSLL